MKEIQNYDNGIEEEQLLETIPSSQDSLFDKLLTNSYK